MEIIINFLKVHIVMKILAFVDLHSSIKHLEQLEKKAKQEKPDIIICAGDFTMFEKNMETILNRIAKLGKTYLIPGNHEDPELTEQLCNKHGINYIHHKIIKINEITLIGWGGEGFSQKSNAFERFVQTNTKKLTGKIILITHAPPYNTKLDTINQQHSGNKSFTKFIEEHPTTLAISGHFHENKNKTDRQKNTKLINPGPEGEIITI